MFYFPGLDSKAWHDPSAFPWTATLRENLDTIREEFKNLNRPSDYKINDSEHKLHSGTWDWFSYVSKGQVQQQFAEQCPVTSQLLQDIPGFMTSLPFAYAFFSKLGPKSNIAPHSAPCNIRLRCHFPLYVPPNCGIRVGDEIREWKTGECLIFDDSYDHQVWHDGDTDDRVVLLFDIWHPDLDPKEQQALTEMFGHAKDQGWLSN